MDPRRANFPCFGEDVACVLAAQWSVHREPLDRVSTEKGKIMRIRLNRRVTAVVAAAVLGVTMAGGAFAYWSAGGTGSGSAMTDTTRALVITQDSTDMTLYPGGSIALTGKITNPNRGQVRLSGLEGTITVTPLQGQVCSAENYSFVHGWMESNVEPAPQHSSTWTGTLSMTNTEANQDGCKGATVNIAYTATPRTS